VFSTVRKMPPLAAQEAPRKGLGHLPWYGIARRKMGREVAMAVEVEGDDHAHTRVLVDRIQRIDHVVDRVQV
jgi:hypothetical protein